MLKTGGVMVKWRLSEESTPQKPGRSGSSGSSKAGSLWAGYPVVYILRWWCPYTSGAVTSVTDRARTKLQGCPSGICPGSKCHFMVAAVNVHGSRGFSRVSPFIKKFLTPSPPLHLEQVGTRLHQGGQVDVTIQWQPPVHTDGLPVFKFQVFWSDHLPPASPSYMRFHMYRRVLDADKTTFVLQSLRPGTIYFVQVRAVVRWKGRQKRGELASTYIETYSPPEPHASHSEEEAGEWEEEEDGESGLIQSVTVSQTFYHHTVLKATLTWTLRPDKSARKYLIYWRAETCARSDHRKLHRRLETSATSHDRRFVLYNLQPECEYAVRVHPVNKRDRTGTATVASFLTPPCHAIHVQQGEPPVCHTADPPGQVQGLHSETSGCRTVIRWERPSSGADDVDSYDVMWGETEPGVFTSTVIYTSVLGEVSVPANASRLEVGRLRSGQHYSVQVWARSSVGGTGAPAVLHLTAPPPSSHGPCPVPTHGSQSPVDKEEKDGGGDADDDRPGDGGGGGGRVVVGGGGGERGADHLTTSQGTSPVGTTSSRKDLTDSGGHRESGGGDAGDGEQSQQQRKDRAEGNDPRGVGTLGQNPFNAHTGHVTVTGGGSLAVGMAGSSNPTTTTSSSSWSSSFKPSAAPVDEPGVTGSGWAIHASLWTELACCMFGLMVMLMLLHVCVY
ncbi:anosmin-1-like [Babylonia areolata]|uniref:anosmin-1-like n=1 Tax=Babylonia areolata TaxID=304850 RepID=UPI003FD61B23